MTGSTKNRTVANWEPGTYNVLAAYGVEVRNKRKQHGLTQQQLADSIGMGRIAIVRIEGGKKDSSTSIKLKIYKAIGADFNLAAMSTDIKNEAIRSEYIGSIESGSKALEYHI